MLKYADYSFEELHNLTLRLEEDKKILVTLLHELGHTEITIDYEYFRKTGNVLKGGTDE